MRNEDDLRQLSAFMRLLRPLKLSWLEAAVFLHRYCRDLSAADVAEITGRHVREVKQARRTLIAKVAVALGYTTPEEAGVVVEFTRLPLTPEERRQKADELRRQGWSLSQIAKHLGVSKQTLWTDQKKAL